MPFALFSTKPSLGDLVKAGDHEELAKALSSASSNQANILFNGHSLLSLAVDRLAVSERHFECARLLLKYGANPNALDKQGLNVAQKAAMRQQRNDLRFIELLIEQKQVDCFSATGTSMYHQKAAYSLLSQQYQTRIDAARSLAASTSSSSWTKRSTQDCGAELRQRHPGQEGSDTHPLLSAANRALKV